MPTQVASEATLFPLPALTFGTVQVPETDREGTAGGAVAGPVARLLIPVPPGAGEAIGVDTPEVGAVTGLRAGAGLRLERAGVRVLVILHEPGAILLYHGIDVGIGLVQGAAVGEGCGPGLGGVGLGGIGVLQS